MAEKSTKLIIPGRFSYLHYHQPQKPKGSDKEKYSTTVLWPKTDKATTKKVQDVVDMLTAQALEKLDLKKLPKGFRICLQDGDEDKPEDINYAGMMFISANADTKPGCVDKDLQPIIEKDEIYSGMYGRASVSLFLYGVPDTSKTGGGRGIGAGLNNIQKLKDGEAFSSKTSAEDDFKDEDPDAEFNNAAGEDDDLEGML